MSRCAGAGREHSQAASPSRAYHRHHAQFMSGGRLGGRNLLFSLPWVQILSGAGL